MAFKIMPGVRKIFSEVGNPAGDSGVAAASAGP